MKGICSHEGRAAICSHEGHATIVHMKQIYSHEGNMFTRRKYVHMKRICSHGGYVHMKRMCSHEVNNYIEVSHQAFRTTVFM